MKILHRQYSDNVRATSTRGDLSLNPVRVCVRASVRACVCVKGGGDTGSGGGAKNTITVI